MILVYSLIIAALLALVFTKSIKKHYWVYYSVAGAIAISTAIFEILRITSNMKLYGFIAQLEKVSIKGIISIAFFVLVMFAGALDTKWSITRKLLSIRAELAIIASILLLPHGVVYFVRFLIYKFPKVLSGEGLPLFYISYTVIGLIGFIVMILLFVTSFKKVRAKMKGPKWKRLQRLAYLFYLLAYVHIFIILINSKKIDWLKLCTYTVLFVGYAILRLMKYYKKRQAK